MSNEKDWIDFNLVKSSVSMEMLIVYLGLYPLRRKGDEVRLKCPFHNGRSDDSMAINLTADTFYCFGCKTRGGVIDFIARYEGCTTREAALRLDEWFEIKKNFVSSNSRERSSRSSFNDGDFGTTTRRQSEPPITALHLIASIELQLARLKKLMLSASSSS